jgi:UDP-glucose 4-epimerase
MSGATRILYASGSGIYGDLGELEVDEDHGPLSPISTYGASKLAGEALISAYCYMFGLSGYVFRFGNVVGPRQTHGVGYDFIRRLSSEHGHLRVLGDGRQSKSYIHVADVVEAVLMATARTSAPVATYNVATGDYMTVSEIAHMALEVVGLDPQATQLEFTGSDRGWRGDVPVVRLSTKRLRALGWTNARSTRMAMREALESILEDASSGRLT